MRDERISSFKCLTVNKTCVRMDNSVSVHTMQHISWDAHRDCMLQPSGWTSYVACCTGFVGGPDHGLDLWYVGISAFFAVIFLKENITI